jgi:hypothetical protein
LDGSWRWAQRFAALIGFARERGFRTFDNLLAGIGISAVIVGVWFVSGSIGYRRASPDARGGIRGPT